MLPGSYDPPTLGHLDIVRRALGLFERVTVAVAAHPSKQELFTPQERVALLQECTHELPGARVVLLEGLLVEGCRELGAGVVVRGVRNGTDFDYEVGMANTNRELAPEIETVLLAPSPACAHISSTLVRQIAGMGGDVSAFVPAPVLAALRERG